MALEMQSINNLSTVEGLKKALRYFGIQPEKYLSQNFLVDPYSLEAIVKAAELTKADKVLEIGAGTGVLTQQLSRCAGEVVAVEFDRAMIPLLRNSVAPYKNISIVQGNALYIPINALLKNFSNKTSEFPEYKIVANLPYHITSKFLQTFLESENPPTALTLLLQKEVAERIAAQPGEMSLLSLSVQIFGQPRVIEQVPRHAFWPAPKVDSAILHIKRFQRPVIAKDQQEKVFKLAKAGFSSRRKTLVNAITRKIPLKREEIISFLKETGLSATARAQELSVQQWAQLAERLGEIAG